MNSWEGRVSKIACGRSGTLYRAWDGSASGVGRAYSWRPYVTIGRSRSRGVLRTAMKTVRQCQCKQAMPYYTVTSVTGSQDRQGCIYVGRPWNTRQGVSVWDGAARTSLWVSGQAVDMERLRRGLLEKGGLNRVEADFGCDLFFN